jgi:hypothetical protein
VEEDSRKFARFTVLPETQPVLLAHHQMEAGLKEQTIPRD